MKNSIKNLANKFLPDKEFILFEYLISFKRLPNLKNPTSINEKIQWLKIYGGFEKMHTYVDKFTVREYVSDKIGSENLVPLLGCWNQFDEIPFDQLPPQFALKGTHGSGYVYVCRDKSQINFTDLKKTVDRWMSENFYNKTREIQYKLCTPKIICEKYLENNAGGLIDYKIYCSYGKPQYIEVHFDRFIKHKVYYTDMNYQKLPISSPDAETPEKISKPKNFNKLVEIARKLSKDFVFVRVDLYSVKNKIYFGELTFAPAGGHIVFHQPEAYRFLGDMIDLPLKNKRK